MFTTPIEGENKPGRGRVKASILTVETGNYGFKSKVIPKCGIEIPYKYSELRLGMNKQPTYRGHASTITPL